MPLILFELREYFLDQLKSLFCSFVQKSENCNGLPARVEFCSTVSVGECLGMSRLL